MLLSLKTGKKCLKVRIKLKGRAKQYAQKGVEGLYNRLPKLENGHAIYKKEKRPTTVYIWWDPKKKSSRGDDRSHWKVGLKFVEGEFGGLGFLDTYNSQPSYYNVYGRRNKWSFWHHDLPNGFWMDAAPGDVSVRCVKRG